LRITPSFAVLIERFPADAEVARNLSFLVAGGAAAKR